MTEVKYKQDRDHVRISIHGHAMFQPGNDPVCAAISQNSYNLLRNLGIYEKGGIITGVAAEAVPGAVTADFYVKHKDIWNVVWSVILTGYRIIEEKYPQNIHVEVEKG